MNIPYQPAQTQGLFREMEERFGVKCTTHERPLGVEMTKGWLRAVGQKLSLEDALAAVDRFVAYYGGEFPTATQVLGQHVREYLTFYRFRERHWKNSTSYGTQRAQDQTRERREFESPSTA